jgi:hypothetical protein
MIVRPMIHYSPETESGSVETTEVLTPASEAFTVPEHAHPHEHNESYAPRDHTHFDEHTDQRLNQLTERLDALESKVVEPVQEVAASVPEVTPEVTPQPRGIRKYIRAR